MNDTMQGQIPAPTVQSTFTSRAVTRLIETGSMATCPVCDQPVKFRARCLLTQVIANVYIDGAWARVEHYHVDCYEDAGRPYGAADGLRRSPGRSTPGRSGTGRSSTGRTAEGQPLAG